MGTEKHLISAVKWTLFAFLLYLIVDYVSNIAPGFRVYGLVILGGFIIYASYMLIKRAKLAKY